MFSINHPMAFVSAELARLIVKKHFPGALYHDRELIVEDPSLKAFGHFTVKLGRSWDLKATIFGESETRKLQD